MKRILIISYLFTPNNSVGSVRPSKLAKYLSKKGYQIDVISVDLKLDYTNYFIKESKYINKLWVINENKKGCSYKNIDVNNYINQLDEKDYEEFVKKRTPKKNNKTTLILKNTYRAILSLKRSKPFIDNFIKFINSNNFDGNKYDVVISTYGPVQSIFAGLQFKKKYPNVLWICDFRDPMVVEDTSPFFKTYYSYLQHKMCRTADFITTVSTGYFKRISRGKYQEKFKIIPNGYDMDDYLSSNNIKNEKKFSFTYVGSLYEGKRDLSPVFKVIRELIDEKVIDEKKISFNYAGSDARILLLQAEEYNLGNLINNHGKLSRDDCLKLQFSSRFLLLSTWNNKKEEGVFPGKFLEYMLINKPIIAIIDGNLPNSEVKFVMEEANLGIAYESVSSTVDYLKLKDYIKKQYNRYNKGLVPNFKPNTDIIERYNWEIIVKQFEELI